MPHLAALSPEFRQQQETFLLISDLFRLLVLIAMLAGMGKVFAKAGRPAWLCLIPGYNLLVAFRIAGLPGWWLLLPLVGLAALPEPVELAAALAVLVLFIVFNARLARRFGEGVHIAIGLTFMAPLFWCWLGFGDAKWRGEEAEGPGSAKDARASV